MSANEVILAKVDKNCIYATAIDGIQNLFCVSAGGE